MKTHVPESKDDVIVNVDELLQLEDDLITQKELTLKEIIEITDPSIKVEIGEVIGQPTEVKQVTIEEAKQHLKSLENFFDCSELTQPSNIDSLVDLRERLDLILFKKKFKIK